MSTRDTNDMTTIRLRKDTRNTLRRLKRGGESYDSVLQHLLEETSREPVGPDEDHVATA